MVTILKISCSWCGSMNDYQVGAAIYCLVCAHRADVLEQDCDCRKCTEKQGLLEVRERERARKQRKQ